LPTWGITWTTVGVRIETLLPNLDSGNLVEMVNSIGRPSMSIAIVDAETMAAEVRLFRDQYCVYILHQNRNDISNLERKNLEKRVEKN
jgi:hypothetical protein